MMKSILVLTLFLLTSQSALSNDDLNAWGSRHSDAIGMLANPPMGTRKAQITAIENLIREIATKLNPDLFKNYQITIGVYPGLAPMAFMEKINPKDSGKILTDYYHLDPNKPAYHLGVSIGLLGKLKTKDQLAFMLGREISHLLEGHLEQPDNNFGKGQKWWSKQKDQSVADNKAIDMMLGRYEISAAVEALWIMADLDVAAELKEEGNHAVANSIQKYLSVEQDRGVRLSMVQSYVEYLRGQKLSAQYMKETALDSSLSKARNQRLLNYKPAQKISPEDLEFFDQTHEYVLAKLFSANAEVNRGNSAYLYMSIIQDDRFSFADKMRIATFMDYSSTEVLAKRAIARILVNSKFTAEQKVAALWRSYFLYRGYVSAKEGQHFEQYLHLYASGIETALHNQTIDWPKTMNTLAVGPNEMLTDPLVVLIQNTANGQKLAQLIIQNLLFRPRQERTTWTSEISSPMKMDYMTFANIIINYPFGKEHLILRSGFSPIPEGVYTKAIRKMYAQQFGNFAYYFKSKDFLSDVLSPDFSNSGASEFLGFFYDLKLDDPYYEVIRDNPLIKAALAAIPIVKAHVQRIRAPFLQKLAAVSDDISLDDIERLTKFVGTDYIIPFSADDLSALSKIFVKLSKPVLYSPTIKTSVENLSSLTTNLLKSNSLPVGDSKQNLETLVFLGNMGIPRKAEDRKAMDDAVVRLSSLLDVAELKKVTSSLYFTVVESRYQQEKNGANYQRQLKGLNDMMAKYNANSFNELMDKIPFFSSDSMNAMPFEMYFDNKHSSYSEEEINLHLGVLSILSLPKASRIWAQRFGNEDIKATLNNLYKLKSRAKRRKNEFTPASLKQKNPDGSINNFAYRLETDLDYAGKTTFLLDAFAAHQAELKDLKSWTKLLRSILNVSTAALNDRPDYKETFEQRFLELSNQGTDPLAYLLVRNSSLLNTLTERALVPVMLAEVKRRMNGSTDPDRLHVVFNEIEKDQKLKEKLPDVYGSLRKEVATQYLLQPHNINKVFPESDVAINSENTKGFSSEIRDLSALVYYVRSKSPQEQIDTIEYLMGRSNSMPQFILESQKDVNVPIQSMAYSTRIRMMRESELNRSFILNSLLTGPDGLLGNAAGQEFLLNHLLKNVGHKDIAREMAEALLKSLGHDKSMAVAYVLAQKTEGNVQMSEGKILKALLEAFGVAGIKLGQYLAFTSELAEFRDALGELQDSAMPVSYLDVLYLVRKRLGENWSQEWNIVKLLGSGSVNLAVTVKNDKTGEIRVISILRDEIEIASKENFRKLSLFVNELMTGKSGRKFSFLSGLLKIIETSVGLEFNKANSFSRQKDAGIIYDEKIRGWTLRAPKAFELLAGTIAMEKASGTTARKIREQDPKMYQEIMTIVLNAEFAHLMNSEIIHFRKKSPFANPDLHDGQIVVDIENRTISILDFGQAVSITKFERDLGLQLIRILSITNSSQELETQIRALQSSVKGLQDLTSEDYKNIFEKTDLMDRFVYLLGVAGGKNWNIPLSTVHFVLGINRLIKIGDSTGINVTARLRTIITTRALTHSTEIGYYLSKIFESAFDLKTEIVNKFQCRAMLGGK